MELLQDISLEKQEKLLDGIAQKVVKMGFVTPVIMFLEMNKPVNFLGSQLMLFLEPLADPMMRMMFNYQDYHALTMMLEKRGNVEKLIRKIELFDQEDRIKRKENKKNER